ncbi:MAG: peroxidase [Pseudobacteriovorax sp.]|nr:peroxidase [Pseudobacteriovorax sp.]
MNILQSLIAYFQLAAQTKWVAWPLITPFLALIILAAEREILFSENLFDVERDVPSVSCSEATLTARTADGTCNDLDNPAMGAVGMRFGRNIDPATLPTYVSDEEILDPNPRDVSIELMTRDEFIPVEQLNVLATAWIQFMVHDWFDHGDRERRNPIKVPLAKDDPTFNNKFMKIGRTKRDKTYDPQLDEVLTYRNEVTHWWDGSQIYGSSQRKQNSLRTFRDGKMKLRAGRLPQTKGFKAKTGFNKNWWVGLTLFHNIFVREHNRIAELLKSHYPSMKDQELFDKARLINTALMAKIHTVEWTPAILANPALEQGMVSNWYGLGAGELGPLLAGVAPHAEAISQMFGAKETLDVEKMGRKAIFGIVGGETDHYDVPYSLTEEFVSVYRMHPLLPDSFKIRSHKDDRPLRELSVNQVRERRAYFVTSRFGFENLWYSFGTEHPGALTLFNYPKALQDLKIPFQGAFDLAAVDIIRDRERGIPRYNEFRKAIRLKPLDDFEDLYKRFPTDTLTPEQEYAVAKLRSVYGTIDRMDLMVGCLAESVRPSGFGFGETAFQIFTLMASRRLSSDRFFTEDFRPEVYTPEGYEIVQTRTFKDVLIDHFPKLNQDGMIPDNAFKPWTSR